MDVRVVDVCVVKMMVDGHVPLSETVPETATARKRVAGIETETRQIQAADQMMAKVTKCQDHYYGGVHSFPQHLTVTVSRTARKSVTQSVPVPPETVPGVIEIETETESVTAVSLYHHHNHM